MSARLRGRRPNCTSQAAGDSARHDKHAAELFDRSFLSLDSVPPRRLPSCGIILAQTRMDEASAFFVPPCNLYLTASSGRVGASPACRQNHPSDRLSGGRPRVLDPETRQTSIQLPIGH